jgi:hypothetical protein
MLRGAEEPRRGAKKEEIRRRRRGWKREKMTNRGVKPLIVISWN